MSNTVKCRACNHKITNDFAIYGDKYGFLCSKCYFDAYPDTYKPVSD